LPALRDCALFDIGWDEPKPYNFRLGALRQRYKLVPRRQLFVSSQQAWVNNLDPMAKFEKMPTPS
jgi:hypothetical protein